jgi:putative CocE/NonD family hydrolase
MSRWFFSILIATGVLMMLVQVQAATREQPDSGPIPPPSPKHEISLKRSIMIPMRDGVELSTDLYFPDKAGDKLPVILLRTGYNKNPYRGDLRSAVAVQDVRGTYESYGDSIIYGNATEDGYDTVGWLATQPWSTGSIGTYGCSYLGDTQMLNARGRNPHLKAMIPQHTGGTAGSLGGRHRATSFLNGGVFELSWFGWFRDATSNVYYRPPPQTNTADWFASDYADLFATRPNLPEVDYRKILWTLPVKNMMKVSQGPPTDWEEYLERFQDPTDPWFDQFNLTEDDRFDVPALFINSWYDYGARDMFYQHDLLRRNGESALARDNQFIITSPTTHCGSEWMSENTVVGERNLGDPRLDYWKIYLDWFDHWLKGIDNGVIEMPKVQYYLMGKNEWRNAESWPLPGTVFTKYYLRSDGEANGRLGDGALSTRPPSQEPPDHYVYDPATPVPTTGGNFCCTGTPGLDEGAVDQSKVEMRHDVLVYTSPLLEEGIEVTGPIEAHLYVSSSVKDTDFTAKLVDVYPDGTAYNVQEGIFRTRFREGFDKKVWMLPGEVYEVRIDLHATSNYFGPGHRIRIEVSSSNFPRFERNLNTGGDNRTETEWVVAKNTLHHSKEYPSQIILPVIPTRRFR